MIPRNAMAEKLGLLVCCSLVAYLVFVAQDRHSVVTSDADEPAKKPNLFQCCNLSLSDDDATFDEYTNFTRETINFRTAYYAPEIEPIGEWKEELLFSEKCEMEGRDPLSACCEDMARKLHFEFYDNTTENSKKGSDELKSKFRGKKVAILGHSPMRNFFMGLAEVFGVGERMVRAVEKDGEENTVDWWTVKAGATRAAPFELWFVQFNTFEEETCHKDKFQFILNKELLKKGIVGADFIILNLGIQYGNCTTKHFYSTLTKMADVIKEESSGSTVIFRSTPPQHYDGSGVYTPGFFQEELPGQACLTKPFTQDFYGNLCLREVAKKYGFLYLDSSAIFMDRYDMHFPDARKLDCTHVCHSPELYIPEMILLNQLLEEEENKEKEEKES